MEIEGYTMVKVETQANRHIGCDELALTKVGNQSYITLNKVMSEALRKDGYRYCRLYVSNGAREALLFVYKQEDLWMVKAKVENKLLRIYSSAFVDALRGRFNIDKPRARLKIGDNIANVESYRIFKVYGRRNNT